MSLSKSKPSSGISNENIHPGDIGQEERAEKGKQRIPQIEKIFTYQSLELFQPLDGFLFYITSMIKNYYFY
jgi:hypothetical protein